MHNKPLIKALLVYSICVLLVTTLVATVMYFESLVEPYWQLAQFTNKYRQGIKTNVFGSLFEEAMLCKTIKCQEEIGRRLSDGIKEEELHYSSDLHFIKQDGNKFYALNWAGKVQDISNKVNKNRPDNMFWFIWNYMHGECNVFNFQGEFINAPFCEYYAKIDLGGNKYGYLSRIFFSTEENLSFLMVLSFVFLLPFAIPTYIYDGVDARAVIIFSIFLVLLPIGLTYIYFKLIKK